MKFKVKDIENFMEEYAPSKYKESYDNVGLMVGDKNAEVTNILIALDCTLDVIYEAKQKNCNFILNHHPLIFNKPKSITCQSLQGKKIIELVKYNINVFASHTNLDAVKGGLNDILAKELGFNKCLTMELSPQGSKDDNITGIGRIGELDSSIKLIDFCKTLKQKLDLDCLRYTGNSEKLIKKVAIINGSGQDFFEIAKFNNVDCILTGDTTYHYVSDYTEDGISIIDVGHFETEWPAFKIFASKFSDYLYKNGYENKIYISESNKKVYKYI